jgi:5'-3' exonuclease
MMRLLLVDAHYYLYRSFFAIRGLATSSGKPTNAIYGFAKALRKMVADLAPTHAAAVWDAGLPERRTKLQPDYKQQRPEMPEDLQIQEDPVREMCPLLGFSNAFLEGTEADDLIASYARAAVAAGMEVIIATADKDILQLAGDRIAIYSTSKTDLPADAGFALLGAKEVEEKWGVPPARIADVLCLTGDSSDNIPGVAGVGNKTAASLVRDFGDASALLNRLPEVKNEKLRAKLEAASDLIRQNMEMVALDENLALPLPLSELFLRPRPGELAEFFARCEFGTLRREVEREVLSGSQCRATQGELFS